MILINLLPPTFDAYRQCMHAVLQLMNAASSAE